MPFGLLKKKEKPQPNKNLAVGEFTVNMQDLNDDAFDAELAELMKEQELEERKSLKASGKDEHLDEEQMLLSELQEIMGGSSKHGSPSKQPEVLSYVKSSAPEEVDLDLLFDLRVKFESICGEAEQSSNTELFSYCTKSMEKLDYLIDKLANEQHVDHSEVPCLPSSNNKPINSSVSSPKKPVIDNTLLSALEARRSAYQECIKLEQTPAKVRRYQRALDTINLLHSKAKIGGPVSQDEIPPEPPKTTESATVAQTSAENPPPGIAQLITRWNEYKAEVKRHQELGNFDRAEELVQLVNLLDVEVPKIISGEQPFDAKTEMPPPPSEFSTQIESTDQQPSALAVNEPTEPVTCANSTIDESQGEMVDLSPSVRQLITRHKEYKAEVIKQRDVGNMKRAGELLQLLRILDVEVPKIVAGEQCFNPETDMPPKPCDFSLSSSSSNEANQKDQQHDPSLSDVISKENIEMRIIKFKKEIESETPGSSRARRIGRVIDQYKEALVALSKGRPYGFQSLPCPPGCPELNPATLPQAGASPVKQTSAISGGVPATAPTAQVPGPSTPAPATSSHTQRVELLIQRQRELREAALKEKTAGRMDRAKEFLRQSLSMNSMISAAESGLPVDMAQLPAKPYNSKSASSSSSQPSQQQSLVVLTKSVEPETAFKLALSECEGNLQAVADLLARTLNEQADRADNLSQIYRKLGQSKMADELFILADNSRRSLTFIKAFLHRNNIPEYQFVQSRFPVPDLNADLDDESLQVTVAGCSSLPNPSDSGSSSSPETFVQLELFYPDTDTPQKHSTDWAKGCDIVYQNKATGKFEVNRKARSFARFVNSQHKTLRAIVYYRRGMFKSYGIIGQAMIPLAGLQTRACIEHSCELLQPSNRRPSGGMVALKIRQRAPLEGNKLTYEERPWLMIQSLPRAMAPHKHVVVTGISSKPDVQTKAMSIALIEFECSLLIRRSTGLSATESAKLARMKVLKEEIKTMYMQNASYRAAYLAELPSLYKMLVSKSEDLRRIGDIAEADLSLAKANIISREIENPL